MMRSSSKSDYYREMGYQDYLNPKSWQPTPKHPNIRAYMAGWNEAEQLSTGVRK